jgi:hypothetical protein
MKKILFIIIFCSLFSGSAFAKKRVCIGVLKDYLNPLSKTPIILAKRNMLIEVVDCYEGNTWNQRYLYNVYGFYKKDEIFKILYPIITKDGNNGWDKWTLDKFEIILGEEQYKFFNLPTSAERKLILEKKAKEEAILLAKQQEEEKLKKQQEEEKLKKQQEKILLKEKKEEELIAKQKKDNPAEERNKLLISCLKDNRETSIKLKNKECEAYADGKEVDIGDDSANPNEFSEISKKNDKIRKYNYDQRYDKCYTEMTVAHSKRGLLKSNIELSVNVRKGICEVYARGEEINYEGKR